MTQLRNLKDPRGIIRTCMEIDRYENEGDQLIRKAVARLFNEKTTPSRHEVEGDLRLPRGRGRSLRRRRECPRRRRPRVRLTPGAQREDGGRGVTLLLFLVLVLVLAAEFVNGWHDASNAIATVVSTRVLSPRVAILMATVFNAVGAFSGTAVAATVGKGIVDPQAINLVTVASAMVAIVVWEVFTWYYGLPTSASHALVAGLSGAGLAAGGTRVLVWEGWQKVLIGVLFSTFLGFFAGLFLIAAILSICQKWSPGRVRKVFGRAQIFSAVFMAFSHGSNDGQKFIGVFTLALLLAGVIPEFRPSFGVVLLCSVTMGLGASVGGWRIIRTMGMRIAKLEPYHGFAAETRRAPVSSSPRGSASRSARRIRSTRRSWESARRGDSRRCAGGSSETW